jgi:GMP synthase-like glutamine amidotransferase
MILLVDVSFKKNSLSIYEYVFPIQRIVSQNGFDTDIKHRTESFDTDSYDAIIICGTTLKDNFFLDYRLDWIKNYEKPLFGICAGAQIIAISFGSELKSEKEIGMIHIETKNKDIFNGEPIQGYALHGNSFEKNEHMDITATSKKCIQGFTIKGRNIYGILFHPEVRNEKIIESFLRLV